MSTHPARSRPASPAGLATLAVGIGLLLLALLLATAGPEGTEAEAGTATPAPVAPTAPTGPAGSAGPDEVDEVTGPTSAPTTVTIPAIDVDARVVGLGLRPDGTVEVPGRPLRVGWFDQGPVPGQAGASVLLGHVDSDAGPAVFARLDEVEPGAQVSVELESGDVEHFEVEATRTYLNADFPARRVYARTGGRFLTLVTCGGDYDPARGGYQSNVVVSAHRVLAPA